MDAKAPDLPAHATLVFQGEIWQVWQWPQKMYDGSVETFERVVRPDIVSVIATVGKWILINVEEQPDRPGLFYSLPGGRSEGGDPLEEAKRELREETGYVSSDWSLWQRASAGVAWVKGPHYFYIAWNCRHEGAQKLDPGERITTKLLSFREFLMLSDDDRLRGQTLAMFLLRLRLDAKAKKRFRELLFP